MQYIFLDDKMLKQRSPYILLLLIWLIIPYALAQEGKIDRQAMELLDEGNGHLSQKEYDKAIMSYDRALQIEPKYTRAWYNRGLTFFYKSDYKESIRSYKKAIELNPRDIEDYWFNIGISYAKLGEHAEAIKYFNMVLESKTLKRELKRDAWNNKGISYYNLYKLDDALYCYDRSIEEDKKFAPPYNNKGIILAKNMRYDEAIQLYNKSIDLEKKAFYAWYNKGRAYHELEQYQEAIESYDEAINISRTATMIWINKGEAQLKLSRYKDACDSYNRTIEIDQNLTAAWNGKGVSLFNLGDINGAINSFNEAIKLNGSNIDAWNNKGVVLQSARNHSAEACEAFVKVRAINLPLKLKISIFAFFLLIYLIISIRILRGHSVGDMYQFFISINLLGLISFYCILSGFFSHKVFAIFLMGGIGLIVTLVIPIALINSIFIKENELIKGTLLAFHRTRLSKFIRAIGVVLIPLFLLIAGFGYFRYIIPSEQTSLDVFRISMTLILLMSIIVTVPIFMAILALDIIHQRVRDIVLFLQLAFLGAITFFSSIIVWSLEFGDIDYKSRALLMMLLILIVLASFIPYFIGWLNSKNLREYYLEKKLKWLSELVDILEFPSQRLYILKLNRINDRMGAEQRRAFQTWKSSKIGNISLDPLRVYIIFLIKTRSKIAECIYQLNSIEKDSIKIELASKYVGAFSSKKDEFLRLQEKERDIKPLLWIILTSISVIILAKGFSSLLEYIMFALNITSSFMTTLSQALTAY